ncbi:MAG: radical SAM protein [Candidatus Omnitrophica bacterium]|nr:radical SAM protein [Candidatus Omnitrophota bacterium]
MQCPYTPQITYTEFSERIYKKIIKNRIPYNGSIELTLRCNLRCAHCYCVADPHKKEMSAKQIKHILDEISDAGCLWLLITGGEPLLRDDFLDIYIYAKKKGMMITLFTNGTLITPGLADYLKDFPPFAIEISLYGVKKETYEQITGIEGSFERCRKSIDILMDRGLPLRLKTMAMSLNINEFSEIEQFVKDLGVEFRFDAAVNSKLDGNRDPCELRISPGEVVKLDLVDPKRVESWKSFFKQYRYHPKSDKLYTCSAGLTVFHVDPYGNLSPCIMARYPAYNLLQGSFMQGWYRFVPDEILTQTYEENHSCADCDLQSICSQCPGWAQFENGDSQTPVEYLCKIAHLRAEVFSQEVNLENAVLAIDNH